jgi:hypothetical protein
MPTSDIQDLRKLRDEFKRKVCEYIEELNKLKEEAELILKGLEGRDSAPPLEKPRPAPPASKDEGVPKSPLVVEAINKIEGDVTAVEVLAVIKKMNKAEHVRDRDIRRVLSRIANREPSPLRLVSKGKGTAPNVYRKLRQVEP